MFINDIKVVKLPAEQCLSLAWTDGRAIFMQDDFSEAEERTILRHEYSHLWLNHFARFNASRHRELWLKATDLEIARGIYDEQDLATIAAPRSRLKDVIIPSTYDVPDDLLYAEDIYDYLLNHPEKSKSQHDGSGSPNCCGGKRDEQEEEQAQQEEQNRENRQKQIDKLKDALDAANRSYVVEAKLRKLLRRKRPSSLASVLDAVLRSVIIPEPSYRRPPRREEPAILLRGKIRHPYSPKVEVYVDRSGSFNPSKTTASVAKLTNILQKYRARLQTDVFFFGDNQIYAKDPGRGYGNTPYGLVAQHIIKSRPKVAVVITDDDDCATYEIPPETTVVVVPVGCYSTSFAKHIKSIEITV